MKALENKDLSLVHAMIPLVRAPPGYVYIKGHFMKEVCQMLMRIINSFRTEKNCTTAEVLNMLYIALYLAVGSNLMFFLATYF